MQIVSYQGKPWLAPAFENLFGFQKSFFLDEKSDEVYGRVQLQKGPLINRLYPLYFKVRVGTAVIPGACTPPVQKPCCSMFISFSTQLARSSCISACSQQLHQQIGLPIPFAAQNFILTARHSVGLPVWVAATIDHDNLFFRYKAVVRSPTGVS